MRPLQARGQPNFGAVTSNFEGHSRFQPTGIVLPTQHPRSNEGDRCLSRHRRRYLQHRTTQYHAHLHINTSIPRYFHIFHTVLHGYPPPPALIMFVKVKTLPVHNIQVQIWLPVHNIQARLKMVMGLLSRAVARS
jgi:hypothetical protein